MDKLIELHLKEWGEYKSRLEKEKQTEVTKYRINSLRSLIEGFSE